MEFDMSKISAFKGLSKELPLKILPFFILKKMIGWKVKVNNEVLNWNLIKSFNYSLNNDLWFFQKIPDDGHEINRLLSENSIQLYALIFLLDHF